jgi:hypothetical protein
MQLFFKGENMAAQFDTSAAGYPSRRSILKTVGVGAAGLAGIRLGSRGILPRRFCALVPIPKRGWKKHKGTWANAANLLNLLGIYSYSGRIIDWRILNRRTLSGGSA